MVPVKTIELTVLDNAIHCSGCENRIQSALRKLAGIHDVKADQRTQHVRFTLDEEKTPLTEVIKRLEFFGYRVAPGG